MREFLVGSLAPLHVVGDTPRVPEGRGFEVKAWHEEGRDVKSFVILDDGHAHVRSYGARMQMRARARARAWMYNACPCGASRRPG